MDAAAQIALVREGFQSPLEAGATWNLVSCAWFQRWKEYVNFSGQPGALEGAHPGEITNARFLRRDEDSESLGGLPELDKDAIEGLDYFALPAKHYQALKAVYGSDVDVERQVIMVGKYDNSPGMAQIELNPIRVNVFVVKSASDATDEALRYLPPTEVFHFSRQTPLPSALHRILDKLALDPPPPYSPDASADASPPSLPAPSNTKLRYWAKTATTAQGSSRNVSSSPSYAVSAAAATPYTKEKTDFVGDYVFLRDFGSSKPSDYDDMLLENAVNMTDKTLDLVIEVGSSHPNQSQKVIWPRDDQLFQWTTRLMEGDLICACDQYGDWFESVVQEITPTSMVVHFKGWGHKYNEKIEAKEYKTRVAPLYTMTKNWRAELKKGSEVDFTDKLQKDGSKWFPGIVTEVDEMFDTVSVKYRDKDDVVKLRSDLDLGSEQICAKGTHFTGEKWDFHNYVPLDVTHTSTAFPAPSATRAVKSPYSSSIYNYNSRGTPVVSGAVGLSNLGNTCFMNSTLQCLSNTPRLTQLFLEDRHVHQINYDNALGHKGELANVYGKLIKDMWSDQYLSVRPEEFKRSISEFAPQFSGYQQHDSSELMMFLLDGLHEDMNRVRKKPHVEKIESKGRDDDIISAESWRRYLLRNDSELVDLCFGQLKSHVTCVGCGYESVTFDEYSSLSLPIPLKSNQEYSFLVYPLPLGTRPIKISVTAHATAPVTELSALLSSHPLFKAAVESRKHSELGKRKNGSESSYLLVDSDTLEIEKELDNSDDDPQAECDVKISHSCSDIETLGNITIDTDIDESVVVVNNSRLSDPVAPSPEKFHFHMCSVFTNHENNRIHKTYDPKDTIRDPSDTLLVAYELEHEVPTDNYNYSRYKYSYDKSPANDDKSSNRTYFDLVVGVKKTLPARTSTYYGSSMNPTYSGGLDRDLGFCTSGHPIRVEYEKGVTTREEMNQIIFDAMKIAYDLPDAYSVSRLPYTIYITNSYGNITRGLVDLADDSKKNPFMVSSYECLICCWNANVVSRDDSSSDGNSGDEDNEHDGVNVIAPDVENVPRVDIDMVSRWLNDGINGTSEGKNSGKSKKYGGLNVMQCFEKFVEREQMPPEETWYCPSCKQHLAPIKKFDIWSAPEVLVVHLKRFQYSTRSSFTFREKLNDLIDFPIEGLNLNDFVKSSLSANERTPAIYDLYAVSEHSGTMGGGHYTARCKNDKDGKWYFFNDSHVMECSPESAVSSEAYVLFYKRRHGHLKWGGLVPSAVPLEK